MTGVVEDSGEDGIEDALVTLVGTPLATITGTGGAYELPWVPIGSYTARAERFRYAPAEAAVTVGAGQGLDLDFMLLDAHYWTEMESDPGWSVSGDAATGMWVRVDPIGTGGGTAQPEDDHTPAPGTVCWVTGQGSVGGPLGEADVDDGATLLTTPDFDVRGLASPVIEYQRWYVNDAGSNAGEDSWVVKASIDGGLTWGLAELTQQSEASWTRVEVALRELFPEPQLIELVRFEFTASDYLGGSIVEAAIDDFQIVDAASAPVGVAEAVSAPASVARLHGNFPNPFNPRTSIRFELPVSESVRLDVFDAAGRLVRELADGPLAAGTHVREWDGLNAGGVPVASGVYFYRLEAGATIESRRMVLAK
jgi:hypothetical protein